ncbi:hypothetical protein [Marinobacter sp. R17]|uniref:hypothetical protein n=1 Tax=Marinobacter sp. R17 TaxID=2484250 RepID=UPI00167FE77A|nr:hypothetical protein [Marinobacter sp. R17]
MNLYDQLELNQMVDDSLAQLVYLFPSYIDKVEKIERAGCVFATVHFLGGLHVLISSENKEITVSNKESHWHIGSPLADSTIFEMRQDFLLSIISTISDCCHGELDTKVFS